MKKRRVFMSLFGVIICAISVGIFKIAALGVDPFQSLMSGLDKLIPISFGTLYVIVNLVLLSFSLIERILSLLKFVLIYTSKIYLFQNSEFKNDRDIFFNLYYSLQN